MFPTLLLSAVLFAAHGAGAPSASAAGAPAYRPPTPSVISAVNGWALGPLTGAQLDQQFAAMQAAGVSTVRIDAGWSQIEPAAPLLGVHTYNWSWFDYRVWLMAYHGLTWLPILDYSAPWAAAVPGDWRSPPAQDADFATYAAAVAARYGPGGSFWRQYPSTPYHPVRMFEIWNEENGGYFWDTGSDPAGYANLYLAARGAIRSVVPSAQVIVGGLVDPASRAISFLNAMFADQPGLRGNVDGIGLHPYAGSAAGVEQTVQAVRSALAQLGEGSVPLDLTEFGWTTDGSTAMESARAQMFSSLAQVLGGSDCGVQIVAPYDWLNPGAAPAQDYGLAGAGGLRAGGLAWFAGLRSAATMPRNGLCAGSSGSAAPAVSAPAATAATPTSAVAPQASRAPVRVAAHSAARARRHRRARRHARGRKLAPAARG